MEKIQEIQRSLQRGKFAETVSSVQQYILKLNEAQARSNQQVVNIVDSEMNLLLNECLIFGFLKLKEYKNARSLARECIKKLSKSGMFIVSGQNGGQSIESDNVPFALKFMSTISIYSESNSRNKQRALIELYQMLRVTDPYPGNKEGRAN